MLSKCNTFFQAKKIAIEQNIARIIEFEPDI